MKRYLELDVFRGVAIVMMVIFHLLYDLNSYRFIQVSLFTTPFWVIFRHVLLFLFVGVSGACVYLIHRNGIRWNRALIWTAKILAGAALVTVVTYYYDPKRFVIFGILHFLAVANLLALVFIQKPRWSFFFGIFLLVLGFVGDINERTHYIPYLAWIGFGSKSIRSFDMVPMIPIFGYTLIGIWMMNQALLSQKDYLWIRLNPSRWWNRTLAFLGRHAFLIYFLHRVLILGLIQLMTRI